MDSTARFFGPDRNLIEIGESLETFVKRLHGSGMTLEPVAQKTSVPLMKVKDILREYIGRKGIDLGGCQGSEVLYNDPRIQRRSFLRSRFGEQGRKISH